MNHQLNQLPKKEDKRKWLLFLLLLLLASSIGGYFWLKPSIAETKEGVYEEGKKVDLNKQNLGKNTNQEINSESKKVLNNEEKSFENPKEEKLIDLEKTESIEKQNLNNKEIKSVGSKKNSLEKKPIIKNNSSTAFEENSIKIDNKIIKSAYKNIPISANENTNLSKKTTKETVGNQIDLTENLSQKEDQKNIQNNQIKQEGEVIQTIDNQQINKESEDKNINQSNNQERWKLWGVNEELKSKPFDLKINKNLPKIAYQNPDFLQKTTQKTGIPFHKGFNIRLSVSPDFSVVGSNKIEKIGFNYGGLIEYRFNKRLSVQTGVYRSKKLYDAYPDQYTWIWKMPETPLTEITATCKMLDLPLNIRYDISQKTDSRWFVSTGVTSYRMINEIYLYNYQNNNHPTIKWRKWAGNSGNYSWSVLNFSTGYEKQVNKKMTIQVEPFAKIPMGKIGFGKVKLNTFGVFFSAKYHIGK